MIGAGAITIKLPHRAYSTGQPGGNHSGAGYFLSNNRHALSVTLRDCPSDDAPDDVSSNTNEWIVFVSAGGVRNLSAAGVPVNPIVAKPTCAISEKSYDRAIRCCARLRTFTIRCVVTTVFSLRPPRPASISVWKSVSVRAPTQTPSQIRPTAMNVNVPTAAPFAPSNTPAAAGP